jgi:hypothetical protein
LSLREEIALLRYNSTSYKLTIHVRGPRAIVVQGQLLRLLVENVETVIEGWYESEVTVQVPCTHCVAAGSYDPFLFPVEELVDAVRSGSGVAYCRGTRKIRIDTLAPDVAFADLSSHLVPYSQIQVVRELGKGAFGSVYEATFQGVPIALKLLEEDGNVIEDDITGNSDTSKYRKFLEFQREAWIMRYGSYSYLHHHQQQQ